MPYLLALDQGTSSSRSILFSDDGRLCAMAQQEIIQHYPKPGWVEHDPEDLWTSQLATARSVLHQAGVNAQEVAAIGIANQRETTLVWERASGRAIHPALVWQDRRTENFCAQLINEGHGPVLREKTGLILDPYFSATKIRWILDVVPGARERAELGELAFGTVDTWLAWKLSGGALHVSDISNAARTLLWNIHKECWDEDLLALFDIPAVLLPQVHPSSYIFGDILPEHLGAAISLAGIAGDQQAALFGQGCFTSGMAKNTYGTGCFLLMHTGSQCANSQHGLISTQVCGAHARPGFALEGSVFIGGAVVQWMRDGLKAIQQAADIEGMAATVPDSAGVVFVPSFTGLGAPYWNAQARGAILGLSRGTTVAHIARAALEAIAFQSTALLDAMAADTGAPLQELRVDGGACKSNLLLQFQADLLGIPVLRPKIVESTAQGAAWLAGLATGIYSGCTDLSQCWQLERRFDPKISRAVAAKRMEQWNQAVHCINPL